LQFVAHFAQKEPRALEPSARRFLDRVESPCCCLFSHVRFSLPTANFAVSLFSLQRPEGWQARRESNPQPPVLETGALPIELLACAGRRAIALLALLVCRVLPAEAAELREFQPFRRLLLVLRRAVIAPLALLTSERDDVSHGYIPERIGDWGMGIGGIGESPTPQSAIRSPNHRYSMISVTVPAPTVRPPSRMAKRAPASSATGAISSPVISVLSPGITISTPSGSFSVPVTSVVRM